MGVSKPEVSLEVPPYLRVYKDGTIERLAGTQVVPAGFDPQTGVTSKDITIIPETGVAARLYRPSSTTHHPKLPLVVYFHGGAFCIASVQEPYYHNSLNSLVAQANIILVSVDYRNAPEHPLPAAYEDSWAALKWVASHSGGGGGGGSDDWLKDHVDFGRVFLAGDSAGANIGHHMAIRVGSPDRVIGLKLRGIILIHPYFWGEQPIGSEVTDPRKEMVDNWWKFVCPSDKGSSDPLINPFVKGAPSLEGLGCSRTLVCIAEKDILKNRGKLYYESLVKSGWSGEAEIFETEGEDHVFHIFDHTCEKAINMIKCLASFINQK